MKVVNTLIRNLRLNPVIMCAEAIITISFDFNDGMPFLVSSKVECRFSEKDTIKTISDMLIENAKENASKMLPIAMAKRAMNS